MRACVTKCTKRWFLVHDTCYNKCCWTRAFWCALDAENSSTTNAHKSLGFLFGGVFTDQFVNPVTEAADCPNLFQEMPIGRTLRVCISTDRAFGGPNALPFGGFYSCRYGNPLSEKDARGLLPDQEMPANSVLADSDPGPETWPQHCPTGYTSHLAAIDGACQVC